MFRSELRGLGFTAGRQLGLWTAWRPSAGICIDTLLLFDAICTGSAGFISAASYRYTMGV